MKLWDKICNSIACNNAKAFVVEDNKINDPVAISTKLNTCNLQERLSTYKPWASSGGAYTIYMEEGAKSRTMEQKEVYVNKDSPRTGRHAIINSSFKALPRVRIGRQINGRRLAHFMMFSQWIIISFAYIDLCVDGWLFQRASWSIHIPILWWWWCQCFVSDLVSTSSLVQSINILEPQMTRLDQVHLDWSLYKHE